MGARMNFDLAVSIFKKSFGNSDPNFDPVTAFRLTQSRLRLEQPILTTSTSYNFPIMVNIQNQGAAYPSEVRLNMQDTFVPTALGIYVAKPASATDAAFSLCSYLNPFVFTTGSAAMGTIYNGNLKLLINNTQYINNWPVMWHKRVPQTQSTQAAGADSPLDQFDGSSYSLIPMQPFVLLGGAQNLQLSITLPVAPATVDANSRLVIVFDGVLAQNSTSVQ